MSHYQHQKREKSTSNIILEDDDTPNDIQSNEDNVVRLMHPIIHDGSNVLTIAKGRGKRQFFPSSGIKVLDATMGIGQERL